MSWLIGYASKENLEKDEREPGGFPAEPTLEVSHQIETARAAARNIIESGAVGYAGKDFRVSLSGHANPSHERTEKYANDYITIAIYQKTPMTWSLQYKSRAEFLNRAPSSPPDGEPVADHG